LSSIDPIEVNEVSDPEIEDFLALEDLDCQKFDPAQPYDFVNNLPPCLEGKDGFTGIRLGQGKITGKLIQPGLTVCSINISFLLYNVRFVYIGLNDITLIFPSFKLRLKHSQLK
jgi:hypothetical protein